MKKTDYMIMSTGENEIDSFEKCDVPHLIVMRMSITLERNEKDIIYIKHKSFFIHAKYSHTKVKKVFI